MQRVLLMFLFVGVFLVGCRSVPPLPETLIVEPQQRDSYDWAARHEAVLERHRTVRPEVVFIGDSITHFWGGEPKGPGFGAASWATLTEGLTVSNLGFGFDYADNAYYRVLHGELDTIAPRLIVVNIGTNNVGHRGDSAEVCAAHVAALVQLIHEKQPKARILLQGLYPRREVHLAEPLRETNRRLAELANGQYLFYCDPGRVLLGADGLADPRAMRDTVHPNAEGYRRLARALREAMLAVPE